MLSEILAGVMILTIQYRDMDMFFLVIVCFLLFFRVFYIKPRASFLSVLALVNTWECGQAYFYHFFGLNKVIRKRNPPGVLFKLFSDSLNMKRLPSDLVLFTLVKVFEENVCWAIVYLFFGLIRLFYEKGIERVLF